MKLVKINANIEEDCRRILTKSYNSWYSVLWKPNERELDLVEDLIPFIVNFIEREKNIKLDVKKV